MQKRMSVEAYKKHLAETTFHKKHYGSAVRSELHMYQIIDNELVCEVKRLILPTDFTGYTKIIYNLEETAKSKRRVAYCVDGLDAHPIGYIVLRNSDNRLLAYAQFMHGYNRDGSLYRWIHLLCVKPEFRRRGLGSGTVDLIKGANIVNIKNSRIEKLPLLVDIQVEHCEKAEFWYKKGLRLLKFDSAKQLIMLCEPSLDHLIAAVD